jgi:hypothetical protein
LAQAKPRPRLEAQTIALRPAIPRSMPNFPLEVLALSVGRLFS